MHNIVAGLFPLKTDVSKLVEDPRNANTHTPESVQALARSLKKFGQRKPIVAHSTEKYVIAGNGTLRAAVSLGWSEIAVVFVDDDPSTASAYAIADNRTAELSDWDTDALKSVLASIDDPDLLGATGWSDSDLESMLAETENTVNQALAELPPEEGLLPISEDGKVARVPSTPTLKFKEWCLYMGTDDAAMLEEKIAQHIETMGTIHGFAGRLVRAC